MSVRAKFFLSKITQHPVPQPDSCYLQLEFNAVGNGDGSGNESWSKWTPQGSLTMTVTNPEAIAQFEIGKSYFLDFTPA